MEEQSNTKDTAQAKKKFYKKWWFWTIIAVAIIVIVAAIAGSSGGKEKESKNYEVYSVGQAYTSQTIGEAYTKTTTEVFAVITISFKNTSDKEITLWSEDFSLIVNGNAYSINFDGAIAVDGLAALEKIGAGITKNLILVFEIPKAAENSAKELQVFSGAKQTKLSITTVSKAN